MIKIGIRFFNKSNDDNDGFFIYDIVEKAEKNDIARADKTVFERVLERQQENNKPFKYRNAVIFGISLVLLCFVIVLGNYLHVYKESLPAEFCEQVITAYENINTDIFMKYCTNLPDVLKKKGNLEDYFKNYLPKDKYDFYEVATEYKTTKKYIFKSGNKKIGEIFFVKNDESVAYGIDTYRIIRFEIYPLTEYRINTYSTFTLLLNGKEIDSRYFIARDYLLEDFGNDLGGSITQDIYLINDLNYIEELKAVDNDLTVYDVDVKTEVSGLDITIKREEKFEELSEYFQNFVFEYMNYTIVDNKNVDSLLNYIHEDAQLYDGVKNYFNEDTLEYDSTRVENFELRDITYYGSGFYICEVSADYLVELEEETVTKSFRKQVSLLYSDGRYYVINLSDIF